MKLYNTDRNGRRSPTPLANLLMVAGGFVAMLLIMLLLYLIAGQ